MVVQKNESAPLPVVLSITGVFCESPMIVLDGRHKIFAIALYFTFYNFVRMHKTLKCSPAMAAGISKTFWSMEDIVALIDAQAEAPKARVVYKPRQPKA